MWSISSCKAELNIHTEMKLRIFIFTGFLLVFHCRDHLVIQAYIGLLYLPQYFFMNAAYRIVTLLKNVGQTRCLTCKNEIDLKTEDYSNSREYLLAEGILHFERTMSLSTAHKRLFCRR